jgi:RimJ/RimL family protein N-acetyltransferase
MLPTKIETERLVLRTPRQSDARAIFESYAQDEAVTRYLMWSPHSSVDETEAFLKDCEAMWASGIGWPYVITLRQSDEPIGMIDARSGEANLTVGYVLARRCWGAGYIAEALDALTCELLSRGEAICIRATCDCANEASLRVLEKCGFSVVGKAVDRFPAFGDENRACLVYELCAPSRS